MTCVTSFTEKNLTENTGYEALYEEGEKAKKELLLTFFCRMTEVFLYKSEAIYILKDCEDNCSEREAGFFLFLLLNNRCSKSLVASNSLSLCA